jgi:CRISPR-associated protein Cmr2
LVKRLALQEYFEQHLGLIDRHIFPSTAGVATAHFKASILEAYKDGHLRDELACYVSEIKNLLSDDDLFYPANPLPRLLSKANELEPADRHALKEFLNLDGDWLYPESLDQSRLEKEYDRSFDKKKVGDSLAALNRFLQAAKQVKGVEPGRKIAIVSMDGDKLGEWIAGGRAPAFLDAFAPNVQVNRPEHWLTSFDDAKQPLTLARHLAISEMLRVFSQTLVPHLVEEQVFGKVIYSGGDDVLAVVAVEDLLTLSDLLRRAFVGLDYDLKKKNQFLKNGYFEDESAKRICPLGGLVEAVQAETPSFFFDDEVNPRQAMTCSVGAVVIHERSPLSHAIAVCFNDALKHGAKETRGRNAFEIHLQQRSGSVLVCGGRWALPIRPEQANGGTGLQESTIEFLDQLRGHFASGGLSPRLVSDMARYALGFSGSTLDTAWMEAGKSALKSMVASHAAKAHRPTVYTAICGLLDLQHQQRVEEAQALIAAAEADQQLSTDDSWQQVCDLLKAIQSL